MATVCQNGGHNQYEHHGKNISSQGKDYDGVQVGYFMWSNAQKCIHILLWLEQQITPVTSIKYIVQKFQIRKKISRFTTSLKQIRLADRAVSSSTVHRTWKIVIAVRNMFDHFWKCSNRRPLISAISTTIFNNKISADGRDSTIFGGSGFHSINHLNVAKFLYWRWYNLRKGLRVLILESLREFFFILLRKIFDKRQLGPHAKTILLEVRDKRSKIRKKIRMWGKEWQF